MTETFYVTKYALTSGIEEVQGEISENYPSIVTYTKGKYGATFYLHGEGKDWHRTKESAIKRANNLRLAKLESLKKQIAKLESINFEL